MKKQTTHIRFQALFLALLISLAFGAKEMHHILGHKHKDVKICDARQGETHLHDESYLPDECQLCDFTFSIFDFAQPLWAVKNIKPHESISIFSYTSFEYSAIHLFQSLRGPPFLEVV